MNKLMVYDPKKQIPGPGFEFSLLRHSDIALPLAPLLKSYSLHGCCQVNTCGELNFYDGAAEREST